MTYVIAMPCVDLKDRACGACFSEEDLPGQWKDYQTANEGFFDDPGSAGGAFKVGAIAHDHPLIAALPPRERAS